MNIKILSDEDKLDNIFLLKLYPNSKYILVIILLIFEIKPINVFYLVIKHINIINY